MFKIFIHRNHVKCIHNSTYYKYVEQIIVKHTNILYYLLK